MSDEQAIEKSTITGLYLPPMAVETPQLPTALLSLTRSGVASVDPLLADVRVEARYELRGSGRGLSPAEENALVRPPSDSVLALEAADGTTIFIHADRLGQDLRRLQPEALRDGNHVDLAAFRGQDAASRGFGDVVWKAISILRLPRDGLAEEAVELARQWAAERLSAGLVDRVYDTASFLGAKALMWKIESRLAGRPGLYHWHQQTIAAEDRCLPGDPRLEKARGGEPMLLLIHGTGSYTVGAFNDLRADEAGWSALQAQFPGGIFGYEHRTFSQSPQENALEILEVLPEGARVSIVSHSRGGLVGDLLCLRPEGDYSKAIAAYQPLPAEETAASDAAGLEQEMAEERQRLRQIVDKLGERRILVERYVRVACPARGTRFLSDNLDVALSDFLSLLQWGGGALVGVVGAALGGPVAGETWGRAASSAIGVVKRLALEIAGRRIDPRMIPGIAAMRVDSPLAAFLAHPDSQRRDGIQMAVIAGDTEFSGFGFSHLGRRAANLFCDWRLFDDHDNDLVVDTDSMYAGLGFKDGTYFLYDQGESVSHFRYFANPLTRDALRDWLVKATTELTTTGVFLPLKTAPRPLPAPSQVRGLSDSLPRVIILPGIMGSHLALAHRGRSERIWFEFFDLAKGALDRLARIDDPEVVAEAIWQRFYGDLAAYLADSHEVIACPYDWRQPIEHCADALKSVIDQAVSQNARQPIRLLAHSMGGLVARALMAKYPESWQAVVDSGGRLVMLGTPNNGAHLMVHTLLGKTSAMRGLEKIDFKHGLQEILDIVAGFPGALSLLPRPTSADDAASLAGDYYRQATWKELKARNTDRWYGDQVAAVPSDELLGQARSFWETRLPTNQVPNPERVSYVFGQGDKTPCGVLKTADGRLQLQFTGEGDGSVTWASGRLDNLPESERCWYLPVEHADLTGEARYFPAILELLTLGQTTRLDRLPRSRGEAGKPFILDAPPPTLPGEDELARAVFGSEPRRRSKTRKASLSVAVRAGDLRFIDQPLICGHFIGDPIAAAEADLDALLEGRLGERERLGVYAGPIGSSSIVLPPRSEGQIARGSRPGAIIVGLGDFNGQLSAQQVSETVRAGVLRLLLLLRDTCAVNADQPIQLYSLLIGCNSTTQISISDSVAAITCGVLEANRQFTQALARATGEKLTVGSLTFIDLYRDVAISAARAVAALPHNLASRLQRLNARLEVARGLLGGLGVRERLSAEQSMGYWSRLIVTDAAAPADDCSADAGEALVPSSTRPGKCHASAEEARPSPDTPSGSGTSYLPAALKYVFLSQRARAETNVLQRQPGLIETIIHKQSAQSRHDPQLAKLLFQLLVPLEYKTAAREHQRLLLILDSYTACLPWELLQADEEPLAVRTPMIRQLISTTFRANVPTAGSNSACVIVSPSTQGLQRRFADAPVRLAQLPHAVSEGDAIRATLRDAGWTDIVYCPQESDCLEVFNHLYRQPYRLLVICGHGIFETAASDGRSYTGVVLSDGMLITAVEIGLMEVVPEVVFLNCCYQAGMNTRRRPPRLAYSLARELIDIGVRCVIVAGWAIDDAAAKTFSCTFFEQLLGGANYGEAIFAARRSTYEQHRGSNTWGAYQAYGDPGYRLGPNLNLHRSKKNDFVAVEELLDCLENRRIRASRTAAAKRTSLADEQTWIGEQLADCPDDWRGRPDVQQALGILYGEYGAPAFEVARSAYLAALQGEERGEEGARVTCRTAEQLANLEARHGEVLIEQGKQKDGLKLIDSAIARLRALGAIAAGGLGTPGNGERLALLGSVLKRKAVTMARAGRNWKTIIPLLGEAAEAYFEAGREGSPQQPYQTLNFLLLDWLAENPRRTDQERAVIARQCGVEANRHFKDSKNFWDAVGGVDAKLVDGLLNWSQEVEGQLLADYQQLLNDVPHDLGDWDSVRRQFELLATLLQKRGGPNDADRVRMLTALSGCRE
ncbi:MAG: CHAT domain-containing protein [Candidatus Accumulibacter sp.]|nr:CHAT domain-containing protein [Accumulibacter sp.]